MNKMTDVFDHSDYWFLDSFKLEGNHISIIINEGITSTISENVKITSSKKIEDCYPIQVTEKSKKVNIKFLKVLAHQIVDESFAVQEEGKIDGNVLCLHHGSAYLQYLIDNSLVSQLIDEPVLHYSLSLADDVINVITTQHPEVNILS
jgi:hypothetical protein